MTIGERNEAARLLAEHSQRYPASASQDMVKLLYQNEFGPGHMISDEGASLEKLRAELRALESPKTDAGPSGGGKPAPLPEGGAPAPLFEEIGNGFSRLHLGPLIQSPLSPETANRFLLATAREARGSMERFQDKLSLLQACCEEGLLPYPPEEAGAFLGAYRAAGCPPPRHSAAYRAAYRPAYRVVEDLFRTYYPLFCRIDALLGRQKWVTVAIDGPSGAGKSTLAALLAELYDASLFHMDHFFLPPDRKTSARLSAPGGNADWERFYTEVARPLGEGRPFRFHIYDCAANAYSLTESIWPKRLRLVEGVYSLHPALAGLYDLKVFLHVGKAEQKRRIAQRSGEAMLQRFLMEWIPLEDRYFDALRIAEGCDLRF